MKIDIPSRTLIFRSQRTKKLDNKTARWVSEEASALWVRWPLILGAIFILFVLFARGGIWGIIVSAIRKRRKRA